MSACVQGPAACPHSPRLRADPRTRTVRRGLSGASTAPVRATADLDARPERQHPGNLLRVTAKKPDGLSTTAAGHVSGPAPTAAVPQVASGSHQIGVRSPARNASSIIRICPATFGRRNSRQEDRFDFTRLHAVAADLDLVVHPVGLANSALYSELGFHWQCDEDPALFPNAFKLLSQPRKQAEPCSPHRFRTVQVRGTDGIFGTHRASAARIARSAQDGLGLLTWRWRTAT